MRHFAAGCGIAFCIATALAAPAQDAESTDGRPKLAIDRTEWDFGTIWYGDPCQTSLELKNEGSAPLRIEEVSTSCGCTATEAHKEVLAPGESEQIRISYNSKKGVTEVHQTVTIKSNDPTRPTVRIPVKGTVKHVYDMQPQERLVFGRLLRTDHQTRTIELRNNLTEPVKLKIAESDQPLPFDVRLEEKVPGQYYVLTAETRDLRAGVNSIYLTLETTSERFPKLTIPVSAIGMERVDVMPSQLILLPGQVRRYVSVNFVPEHPIKVTEVRSGHPALRIDVPEEPRSTPAGVFREYRLWVTVEDFDAVPAQGVEIEIFTDDRDPRFQKLVVPVQTRRPRGD